MLKPTRFVTLAFFATSIFSEVYGDEQRAVEDIRGNINARLMASRLSENRAAFRLAIFKTLEKSGGQEIQVRFPHYGLTAHGTTIERLVASCTVNGEPLADQPEPKPVMPERAWRSSTVEAIFSLPKNSMEKKNPDEWLDSCYLVSLKLTPNQKEPPPK